MESGSGAGTRINTYSVHTLNRLEEHISFKQHFKHHLTPSNKNHSRYNMLQHVGEIQAESYGTDRACCKCYQCSKATQTVFVLKISTWNRFILTQIPQRGEANSPFLKYDLVIAERCEDLALMTLLLLELTASYFPQV